MPFLDDDYVRELLAYAQLSGRHGGAKDYCRTCDEFYWLHDPDDGGGYDSAHDGHRLTIVPFVEDRSR